MTAHGVPLLRRGINVASCATPPPAMLAAPYLVLGVLWALTHTGTFETAHGVDRVLVFVRTVVFWPMLLLTNMCLP